MKLKYYGHMNSTTQYYKNAIIASELQKCHFGLKMLAQWHGQANWHDIDVTIMWEWRENSLFISRFMSKFQNCFTQNT